MIYKFKAAFTKLGVGTAPSSAPVCTVVDADDNILASAQATVALANLPGVYLYSYTGSSGLDLVALFHTTDATVDQQDLYSYTSDLITDNLDTTISSRSSHSAADVWDELTSGLTTADTIGKLLVTNVDAKISDRATLGVGAIEWTYNLKDNLGANIADATIWVTSDITGIVVLASGLTDANGNVTFYLDAGTVYIWGQKSGYNFDNPDTEIVS